jgi:hypothetical protein
MKAVYQKQQRCLKVQRLLIVIQTVANTYGGIIAVAHTLFSILWGGFLSSKATALAREKYPYVPIGPGYGGRGFSWDTAIMAEASCSNDDLTIKILKFNYTCIWTCIAGLLAYAFVFVLIAFVRDGEMMGPVAEVKKTREDRGTVPCRRRLCYNEHIPR